MNLLCCQVKPVSSVNHQASVIPRALSLCFQNLKLVKHKDNLSALEVDKKKCKNEGKKKTSLFFFFFLQVSAHLEFGHKEDSENNGCFNGPFTMYREADSS